MMENSIYEKIYTMLQNDENPLDKYKVFIYNIHNMSPIAHAQWTDKLHTFPVWKQIMKDFIKERDTEHTKQVVNGYGHTFVDFDGDITTFICECGIKKEERFPMSVISINEIGNKSWKVMLCHCNKIDIIIE